MDSLPPEKKKKVVASEYIKIIIMCGSYYPFKVTGDSLHLEIFASNKLFVSPQGKQLWSWNKNEIIANMMTETAVSTLKRPSRRESQAMAAIVTNSCVKFYLDKGV